MAAALARVSTGDHMALRQVYDRTSAKLFGICIRICRDREAAEEVLQEVYIAVWHRARSFDAQRASPITWLATIARNRAIDWVRARPKVGTTTIEAADDVVDPGQSASEQIESADERDRILHCLDELDGRQSSAIRTAFFDGFTYSELADRESVPLGTMKSWIRRGLQALKKCLERD